MQLRDKCLCLTAVLLVIRVSSAYPYDGQDGEPQQQQQEQEQSKNVRDKRTLNFLLQSFADAIGYDVQKRPSALPFGAQVAPGVIVPLIPPLAPITPAKAPAMVPAPAGAAMAPAGAAMAPAAGAMAPAAGAMTPAAGAMTPAKPAMAAAPAAPAMAAVPAAPAMAPAPAAPAMPPAPAAPAMAPAKPAVAPPAAMAPAGPAMPPAAAAAIPVAPAVAPAAPAMPPATPPAGGMAPAPASPAAPAMPPAAPAAPAGKSAPLLTETIRKVFNLNFNWNRNLQPQRAGVAPGASGAPAPQTPSAGAPQMPTAAAPAPAAPQMPAAPAAPQMPAAPVAGPAVPNIVPLAIPAAKDPVPAPMTPAVAPVADPAPAAPAMTPAAPAMTPAAPEMAPAAPKMAPPAAPASAPLYYQPIQNVEVQPNAYQDLQAINQPQQVLYYPTEQTALNEATSNENLQKDYSLPEAVELFWRHSPWNQPQLPLVQNAVPEYRQYSTPDGERGYHVRRVQQNAHLQHHDLQPQDDDAAEEVDSRENSARERQEDATNSEETNDDANGDSSKAFLSINNQPRGFQPPYAESRNQYQNGGFYQPGLPLAVHGIHEDKVLVAWPSPFELAGSEKKLNKVNPHGRISSAASENLEYRYQPDNYDQFNFFTIPPAAKDDYERYETPSEPNIEDTLSPNARIHENNFGKKYTTVHLDRHTYHH